MRHGSHGIGPILILAYFYPRAFAIALLGIAAFAVYALVQTIRKVRA